MKPLRITLWQADIAWEDKEANLTRLRNLLENLRGETDLVVVPELFSTGFTMNTDGLAEPVGGKTIGTLRQWAVEYGIALAGSYVSADSPSIASSHSPSYYNRAFFLTPDGQADFADKRHLFRMGGEAKRYTPGTQRNIIHYKEWRILLLVCYDLRFPVWSRNAGGDEYDLLLYVANWPASRQTAWTTLLRARAIENLCYVCGVNRVGRDAHGWSYQGGSLACSPQGEVLASLPDMQEGYATLTLDPDALHTYRQGFPAWKDADPFLLIPHAEE